MEVLQQLRNYAHDSEMLAEAEPYFWEFAVEVWRIEAAYMIAKYTNFLLLIVSGVSPRPEFPQLPILLCKWQTLGQTYGRDRLYVYFLVVYPS